MDPGSLEFIQQGGELVKKRRDTSTKHRSRFPTGYHVTHTRNASFIRDAFWGLFSVRSLPSTMCHMGRIGWNPRRVFAASARTAAWGGYQRLCLSLRPTGTQVLQF